MGKRVEEFSRNVLANELNGSREPIFSTILNGFSRLGKSFLTKDPVTNLFAIDTNDNLNFTAMMCDAIENYSKNNKLFDVKLFNHEDFKFFDTDTPTGRHVEIMDNFIGVVLSDHTIEDTFVENFQDKVTEDSLLYDLKVETPVHILFLKENYKDILHSLLNKDKSKFANMLFKMAKIIGNKFIQDEYKDIGIAYMFVSSLPLIGIFRGYSIEEFYNDPEYGELIKEVVDAITANGKYDIHSPIDSMISSTEEDDYRDYAIMVYNCVTDIIEYMYVKNKPEYYDKQIKKNISRFNHGLPMKDKFITDVSEYVDSDNIGIKTVCAEEYEYTVVVSPFVETGVYDDFMGDYTKTLIVIKGDLSERYSEDTLKGIFIITSTIMEDLLEDNISEKFIPSFIIARTDIINKGYITKDNAVEFLRNTDYNEHIDEFLEFYEKQNEIFKIKA